MLHVRLERPTYAHHFPLYKSGVQEGTRLDCGLIGGRTSFRGVARALARRKSERESQLGIEPFLGNETLNGLRTLRLWLFGAEHSVPE